LLLKNLSSFISRTNLDSDRPLFEIEFKSGVFLYVRFNDFDEYAYHIQFSHAREDRIRYDNYDENWPVRTAPHHVHARGSTDASDPIMVIAFLCIVAYCKMECSFCNDTGLSPQLSILFRLHSK